MVHFGRRIGNTNQSDCSEQQDIQPEVTDEFGHFHGRKMDSFLRLILLIRVKYTSKMKARTRKNARLNVFQIWL
jgi:hypothetical protein